MKNIAIAIIVICSFNVAFSQRCDTISYQGLYRIDEYKGTFPFKISAADGSIFIAGITSPIEENRNEFIDAYVMKLTDRGTPVWSNNIGGINHGFLRNNEFLEDMKLTSDGGVIICGNTQVNNNVFGDGWISKLNDKGELIWSAVFNSRLSRLHKVIELTDGSVVAIGTSYTNFSGDYDLGNVRDVYNSEAYMVRMDKNGRKIWARSFYSRDLNDLRSIVQLRDGNLLVEGSTKKYGLREPAVDYIAKTDVTTGEFLWTTDFNYSSNLSGDCAVNELSDGTLKVHMSNYITYYDSQGNPLKSSTFNVRDSSFTFCQYIASGAAGEDYYYAYSYREPYLFKIINDKTIGWARHFIPSNVPGSFTELRDVVMYKNAFYLNVNIQAEGSPLPRRDDYAYVIKTGADGKTPCSDTLATPFVFQRADFGGSHSLSFTNNGSPIKPGTRAMYSHAKVPHVLKDCYNFTCCGDTVLYKNVALCEGSMYTLPDGNLVSAESVYPVSLKTERGCDSIININLTVQHKVNVSLGGDTCFSAYNFINYRLSYPQKVKYQWQDGSTDSEYVVRQPGQYWVRVSTVCNTAADTVTVFKTCDFPVFIPGAFTPNNDGLNDLFRVAKWNGQRLVSLSIYNRFGQRIFVTANPAKGWDGKLNGIEQSTGAYIYLIRYKDIGDRVHELKGTVVLIR